MAFVPKNTKQKIESFDETLCSSKMLIERIEKIEKIVQETITNLNNILADIIERSLED